MRTLIIIMLALSSYASAQWRVIDRYDPYNRPTVKRITADSARFGSILLHDSSGNPWYSVVIRAPHTLRDTTMKWLWFAADTTAGFGVKTDGAGQLGFYDPTKVVVDSSSHSRHEFKYRVAGGAYKTDSVTITGATNVSVTRSNDTLTITGVDSVRTSGRAFRIRIGGGSYRQDSVTVIASTNITVGLSHDTLTITGVDSVRASHASDVSRHTMWFTGKKSQPTKADSSYCTEVSSPQTWTIDSVKASKKGAFTATANVDRLRSGTYARMYASNYTLTTTLTNMGSITNNTLVAGDQVFVVWPTFSGTTDISDEINLTFFYRLTQ